MSKYHTSNEQQAQEKPNSKKRLAKLFWSGFKLIVRVLYLVCRLANLIEGDGE